MTRLASRLLEPAVWAALLALAVWLTATVRSVAP